MKNVCFSILLTISQISSAIVPISFKISAISKIQWSEKMKESGQFVGINEEGNNAFISSKNNLNLYTPDGEFVKAYKLDVGNYIRQFVSDGEVCFFTGFAPKAKGEISLRQINLNDGTISDPVEIIKNNEKYKQILIHSYVSPDRKTALIIGQYMLSGKEKFSYALINIKDMSVLYNGAFTVATNKLDILLRHAQISNNGNVAFVVSTAKSGGYPYNLKEIQNYYIYVADKSNNDAVNVDFKKEIKAHIMDVNVKTLNEGGYVVYGVTEIPDASVAERYFVLKYKSASELAESKLPDADKETKGTAIGKMKDVTGSIKTTIKSTDGNYKEHFAIDYIGNSDGSSYLILESANMVQITRSEGTSYHHIGGNLEIMRLDAKNKIEWQKTVYKNENEELERSGTKSIKTKNSYYFFSKTFSLIHKNEELKILIPEKSTSTKNKPSPITWKEQDAIMVVELDQSGAITKSSAGIVPDLNDSELYAPVKFKNEKLYFVLTDGYKSHFGVLDLKEGK